jgi:hypothetical protein
MTKDGISQETSELDPVIPGEVWRPAVTKEQRKANKEFFLRMAESYPENYDLVSSPHLSSGAIYFDRPSPRSSSSFGGGRGEAAGIG